MGISNLERTRLDHRDVGERRESLRFALGARDRHARSDHDGEIFLEAVCEHGGPRLDAEDHERHATLGLSDGQVDGRRDALESPAEDRPEIVVEVDELLLHRALHLREHVCDGVGELHEVPGRVDLHVQRLHLGHVLRRDDGLGGDLEVEGDVEARDGHVGVGVDVHLEDDPPLVESHGRRASLPGELSLLAQERKRALRLVGQFLFDGLGEPRGRDGRVHHDARRCRVGDGLPGCRGRPWWVKGSFAGTSQGQQTDDAGDAVKEEHDGGAKRPRSPLSTRHHGGHFPKAPAPTPTPPPLSA